MKITCVMVLLIFFATVAAEEWYQQGNPKFLDWNNFDQAVSEPNTYKFVKYFTHSCRYCRMLKQVEEQLQAEKQWLFTFYQVDCTLHYDLCSAKASPSAFPFVGVYNHKGELQAQIGGYYPLDTMREAFKNIEGRQIEAMKAKGMNVDSIKPVQKEEIHEKAPSKLSQPEEKVKIDESNQNAKNPSPKTTVEHGQEDQSKSVSRGIKLLLALVGFWLFSKQIKPYLEQESQSTSRKIQIPVPQKGQSAKIKKDQVQQSSRLLQDNL